MVARPVVAHAIDRRAEDRGLGLDDARAARGQVPGRTRQRSHGAGLRQADEGDQQSAVAYRLVVVIGGPKEEAGAPADSPEQSTLLQTKRCVRRNRHGAVKLPVDDFEGVLERLGTLGGVGSRVAQPETAVTGPSQDQIVHRRSAEHVQQRIRRVRTDIRYLESQPGQGGNVLAQGGGIHPFFDRIQDEFLQTPCDARQIPNATYRSVEVGQPVGPGTSDRMPREVPMERVDQLGKAGLPRIARSREHRQRAQFQLRLRDGPEVRDLQPVRSGAVRQSGVHAPKLAVRRRVGKQRFLEKRFLENETGYSRAQVTRVAELRGAGPRVVIGDIFQRVLNCVEFAAGPGRGVGQFQQIGRPDGARARGDVQAGVLAHDELLRRLGPRCDQSGGVRPRDDQRAVGAAVRSDAVASRSERRISAPRRWLRRVVMWVRVPQLMADLGWEGIEATTTRCVSSSQK